MRFALAAVSLFVFAPAVAHASPLARIVTRDVDVAEQRIVAARFTLVGLHWQGTGSVSFRTRSLAGRWSAWRVAAPEPEDGPDHGSVERRRGWRLGNPYWTGPSNRIEYRLRGDVRRLRAHFVWSPPLLVPTRAPSLAQAPFIVPRSGWNANEKIRRRGARYAPVLRYALVHHTAGASGYTRAQSAAIVRAIQLYHVRGNGWDDIGYNFLVDRFGQVFEGRYGGAARNVVGAHAAGFNRGSVGVAMIGTYGSQSITNAARDALVRLLAWRLDVAHVDPASKVTVLSSGNPRFPTNAPVLLRAIGGHRDTGFTTCPGDALYRQLGAIAAAVARTGLPKLYSPVATVLRGGAVRFTARLSAPLAWRITVRDADGATVASRIGLGSAVHWTWPGKVAAGGRFAYTIGAGTAVLPATGTFQLRGPAKPPPPASGGVVLSDVRVDPPSVVPTPAGAPTRVTLSYALTAPARITVGLLDAEGTEIVRLGQAPKRAGTHTLRFSPAGLAEGRYRIAVTAETAAGVFVTAEAPLVVSDILTAFLVEPGVFSPNRDGWSDDAAVSFALTVRARVRVSVGQAGVTLASLLDAQLEPGVHGYDWDGTVGGRRVADGVYEVVLELDAAGRTARFVAPVVVDTVRPRLTLVSLQPLRLSVSEPATVTLTVDGTEVVREVAAAGTFTVPYSRRPARLTAVARDVAGNASATVKRP